MTVPFSAALTLEPSGTSILMPVPREAAKSVMIRPETGQPNLSLPEATGSAAGGAMATWVGAGVATGVAAGAAAAGAGAVAAWSTLVLARLAGRAAGSVVAVACGLALATWTGALLTRSDRPGMTIFWPTTILSGEPRLLAW